MKSVAIMQPYFFPYFGYFQLISAVDIYVNLDHVSFMKRSYMTRNELQAGYPISIPVKSASQNKNCREVLIDINEKYISTFQKTLRHLYAKSPYFDIINHQIIEPCFQMKEVSISAFNIAIIQHICQYLNIQTPIIETSCEFNQLELKKEAGLKSIVHQLNGSHYINAIGGQSLYDKTDFLNDHIQLQFLKMGEVDFKNPYHSILDLLFNYDSVHIQSQLNKFTLE
jgi:hypothetical protein